MDPADMPNKSRQVSTHMCPKDLVHKNHLIELQVPKANYIKNIIQHIYFRKEIAKNQSLK